MLGINSMKLLPFGRGVLEAKVVEIDVLDAKSLSAESMGAEAECVSFSRSQEQLNRHGFC